MIQNPNPVVGIADFFMGNMPGWVVTAYTSKWFHPHVTHAEQGLHQTSKAYQLPIVSNIKTMLYMEELMP